MKSIYSKYKEKSRLLIVFSIGLIKIRHIKCLMRNLIAVVVSVINPIL